MLGLSPDIYGLGLGLTVVALNIWCTSVSLLVYEM